MFRCRFLGKLNSYIDNQLSEKEKPRLEAHLQSCKTCQNELARLHALAEKLKNWQAPVPNADFDTAVRNKIVAWELGRSAVKMKKKTLAILIPSGALAGILVLVLVVGTMQSYLKHGIEGRLRGAADMDIAELEFQSYDAAGAPYAAARTQTGQIAKADKVAQGVGLHGGRYNIVGDPGTSKEKTLAEGFDEGKIEIRTPYGAGENAQGSVIVIQPMLPATGEGEWIIRTGNVRLEAADGKETYKKISQICQELGGYLANSNFYLDREGREAGTVTMRIPKDKFLTALDKLGALGKVENISTNSQDVRQEYSNLKAQLDAAMVVYNKMLEALQKRQVKIDEAVRLESELTPVLRKVEDLKNRIERLNNSVSFTTISVNFHEAKVSAKLIKESMRSIKEGLIKAGVGAIKFIAAAIPVLVILGLFLVVAVMVIRVIKYWITKLFKRG